MAPSIRILAPIPGKSVIGIEIPNLKREQVFLKEVIANDAFLESSFRLPIALGVNFVGTPVVADLTRMPHLLIAGTTGSGKSVALNAMICSILFKAHPDDVKFLMIDPKRLELSSYEGIPHLIHPVVVDPKKASQVLRWTVEEMERRYRILNDLKAKSIDAYNELLLKGLKSKTVLALPKQVDPDIESERTTDTNENTDAEQQIKHTKLPYLVVVIDELADLMMVAPRDVEESLTRLAQMARAAGIHLIIATQRPSVDVITGLIKANFPTRISFQVSSKIDSRTIIDQQGAEKLLGAEICFSFHRGHPGFPEFMAPTFRTRKFHVLLISSKCRPSLRMIPQLKNLLWPPHRPSMKVMMISMKNMTKPWRWSVNWDKHPYHLSSAT